MPYEYLDDVAIADIAFNAWGGDLEEVFICAGEAVINAMIDNLDAIETKEEKTFTLENEALDMLLFDCLQELVYHKDSQQLLLRLKEAKIDQADGKYRLSAKAAGEKLDPERHHQRVDVKAVTLHKFDLAKTDEGWTATVVLDI